ncbi:MAG TPA: septum site-determining protein MinC, partial [Clostridiales bacterium]|nr:septum site-determining protein MinC [Clostridiales bacterium]
TAQPQFRLKLLCGALTPYRGKLQTQGRVSMLPQDPQTLFVKKTVYEDLYAVSKNDEKVRNIAALCCLTELLDRHPYDLSGGQQQRAALAMILLQEPDVLLLD